MKIVFCSTSIAAYDRRMIRIIKTLKDQGKYEIEWVSRYRAKVDSAPHSINHINTFFKSGFLFYAEFNIRLLFALLGTKADLISAVDLDTLLACTIAAKLKRTKLVFDAHEYFSEVPELKGRTLVKWFWKSIGKMCVSATSRRYTVGPILAKTLGKNYKVPFDVIRNVPNTIVLDKQNQTTSGSAPFDKTVCYLGVLNHGRGLKELIKAIKSLPTDYGLLLIGDGDISQELKQYCTDLNLNERVIFTGMVRPNEIPKLMSTAWCGVNILDRKSESYYLSLANKTFDYINLELPALLCDFPEYKNLNADTPTAVLIPDIKPESIVNGLQKLADQPIYAQLKANCKTQKSKYNWEIESAKLANIYDSKF